MFVQLARNSSMGLLSRGAAVFAVAACALVALSTGHLIPLQRRMHYPSLSGETRRLQVSDNVPMRGDIYPLGIFYGEITVGNPPVHFNISFDTGSTDLLIPAVGCTGCPKSKESQNKYDPRSSITANVVTCPDATGTINCTTCIGGECGFYNSYITCDLADENARCNISGPIYTDTVSFGPGLSTKAHVGAITSQTTNFDQMQHVDGIMGLAYWDPQGMPPTYNRSEGMAKPVIQELVDQHLMADMFAMCLNNDSGVLSLGDGDWKDLVAPQGTVQWTPITFERWYGIEVTKVLIDGKAAPVTAAELNEGTGGCSQDSGTNYLMLTNPGYNAVKTVFTSMCADTMLVGVCNAEPNHTIFDGACVPMTTAEMARFPALSVEMSGGATVTATPFEYLIHSFDAKTRQAVVCLGLLPGTCLLGDIMMLNYVTIYDRGNQRLGFAPVNRNRCAQ